MLISDVQSPVLFVWYAQLSSLSVYGWCVLWPILLLLVNCWYRWTNGRYFVYSV